MQVQSQSGQSNNLTFSKLCVLCIRIIRQISLWNLIIICNRKPLANKACGQESDITACILSSIYVEYIDMLCCCCRCSVRGDERCACAAGPLSRSAARASPSPPPRPPPPCRAPIGWPRPGPAPRPAPRVARAPCSPRSYTSPSLQVSQVSLYTNG